MNFVSFNSLFMAALLTTTPLFAKRPPREKPIKPPKKELSQEQKQVIMANVVQVMNGVCTIAQDPHNPHNIGSSIATMIHALINIIIEKLAKRTFNFNNAQNLDECINEISAEINKEIIEIFSRKKLIDKHKTRGY